MSSKGIKALEEIVEFYERHLDPVDMEECQLAVLFNNTIPEEVQRLIQYADMLRQRYETKFREKYGNENDWE